MDWRVVTAIVISTLTLTAGYYHRIFGNVIYDRLVFHLGAPLLTVLVIFRESPARYGFRLGEWKAGLALTAAGCIVSTILAMVVARTTPFQEYYGPQARSALPLPISIAIELFGWAFLFRGFLLFALYRVCGPYAIVLQAVPFAIAHFGKPEIETLSALFGGSAFGYIAWRTGSFLYPFLIHWCLNVLIVLFAASAAG
jgi:membrane protease YdiL (CAAX protease family)